MSTIVLPPLSLSAEAENVDTLPSISDIFTQNPSCSFSTRDPLNISTPICKTTAKCTTKAKIVEGKICMKRRTYFKTKMYNGDSTEGEYPSVTSVCYQYFELPLEEVNDFLNNSNHARRVLMDS